MTTPVLTVLLPLPVDTEHSRASLSTFYVVGLCLSHFTDNEPEVKRLRHFPGQKVVSTPHSWREKCGDTGFLVWGPS